MNDATGRLDILAERLLGLAARYAEYKLDIPGLEKASQPEIRRLVSSIKGSRLSPLLLLLVRKSIDEYAKKIAT